MVKKTEEYKYLEKRIRKLKADFNFRASEFGITEKQEDLLKGFRLLCHAELEDYFESIALRIFNESANLWISSKKPNFQISCYFIMSERIATSDDAYTKSVQMIQQYEDKFIKHNNGIKEDNIKKMYMPLGYRRDDFDTTLLAELDSFGSDRGEAAHASKRHTTIMLDKVSEFERMDRLLLLIIDFENSLRCKYRGL